MKKTSLIWITAVCNLMQIAGFGLIVADVNFHYTPTWLLLAVIVCGLTPLIKQICLELAEVDFSSGTLILNLAAIAAGLGTTLLYTNRLFHFL